MAHKFGALALPIPAPATGASVSDTALDILGAYLKAVLLNYGDTAWTTRAPGETLVRSLRLHDPNDQDFNSNDLPALYLWRSAGIIRRKAEEYLVDEATLDLAWVGPPSTQSKGADRAPFINGLIKTLATAIELGRHSSWVLAGDPDTTAALRGSVVLRHAGLDRMFLSGPITKSPAVVTIREVQRTYPGFTAQIRIDESLVIDPNAFPDTGASSLDIKITTQDGLRTVVQRELPAS